MCQRSNVGARRGEREARTAERAPACSGRNRDRARAKAQAELFQLRKLEAIGRLTGGIAHDFNNLLTVVTSGLELLAQPRDQAHRDRPLNRIQEAAWRGAQLTQRLLAFARRQPLHPERLDVLPHMHSMGALLGHALREDIELRLDVAANVWPIETDIAALELALLNLAVNARDAMPDGGTLILSARNEPLPDGAFGRLELSPGDYVRVSLIDNGTGMPPELMEKVFQPFFSTKPDGKGTGRGLAQVYGFARQSAGGAMLESTLGQGTAVHIPLPRSRRPPPRPRAPDATPATAAYHGSRLKILVVEDDAVAAMVLEMLDQLGHSALRVATVASALAVLSGVDEFDLVLSDVLLPGGGCGLDLAREMGRRRMAVPVILSGFGGSMTQRPWPPPTCRSCASPTASTPSVRPSMLRFARRARCRRMAPRRNGICRQRREGDRTPRPKEPRL